MENSKTTDTFTITIDHQISIPIQTSTIELDINDNLEKCLLYLDKTYNQNIWKSLDNTKEKSNERIESDYKTSIYALIELFYNEYSINNIHLLNLNSFNEQTLNKFTFEFDTTNLNNLYKILLYSPRSIDSNNEKILFIFYQLLKLFKYLHSKNLNYSELKLSDIYIDKNLCIRIKPSIETILTQYIQTQPSPTEHNQTVDDDENHEKSLQFYSIRDNLETKYESLKHLNYKDLSNLTKQWCDCKLSNFDYLLILNSISGRDLNCPYNHPIFPWITDFQSFNTNLRDLSISKFRLNKGDPHLDLTYQAAKLNTDSQPAYHLTEFLSEITYFVYKSRVTSKETLCEHVRRNWVPNEYPRSIDRLYMWTPEECIPEFYCDSNIFKTIHDDLPDLKVPDWCNGSVDEFIRTHRLLLESDLVSKKLHCWIDLVFGFKLSGEAAVENKNVCLPLIDNHQTMKPFGIVQLFNVPHPCRAIDKYYHSKQMPNIVNRSRLKGNFLDDSTVKVKYSSFLPAQLESEAFRKRSISTKLESNNEVLNTQIQLPDDYSNPLLLVDQIETLLKFTNKAYNSLPDSTSKQNTQQIKQKQFEDFAWLDVKCLTCLLTEIVFFNRLKCLPQQNSLETRCSFINKMFLKEPHILTGPFATLIQSVLKPLTSNTKEAKFINIDTLLNTHLTILPFKPYFEQIYKFSTRFTIITNLIENYSKLTQTQIRHRLNSVIRIKQQCEHIDLTELCDHLNQLSLSYMPQLMTDLSNSKTNQSQSICYSQTDSFELILTYLEDLFSNPHTCVDSFLFLFTKLSRLVSRTLMRKKFLPIILHMLNVVDLYETIGLNLATNVNEEDKIKFCKLFDFKFINELRIIFGLEVFLVQICPFLIEAISGFKDLDYESINIDSIVDTQPILKVLNKQRYNDQSVGIFDMESDLNKVEEENVDDDEEEDEFDSLNKSTKSLNEDSKDDDLIVQSLMSQSLSKQKSFSQFKSPIKTASKCSSVPLDLNHLDTTSLCSDDNALKQQQQTNISTTAFNTFIRLVGSIGPVLTCKYCCSDLLKMLAICYMNNRCLLPIEAVNENPLNSCRAIEGDRFSFLILESLKFVAVLYGEQVIVLQYFTNVSNSISACSNRLTIRLEASVIAGIVLVNYFINYLDIKLLMENLNYILYQILQPVINLYSNETIKFPNGASMRQAIAFKVLDIILLLSLRIGPEQTRIEMEFILKAYFNAFNLVRNTIINQKPIAISKPLIIRQSSTFKPRSSIVAFSHSNNSFRNKNSFDEYLKFSYDKSTNEIIGSSIKADTINSDTDTETTATTYKYRTHSIGLLSLNIDENDASTSHSMDSGSSLESNATKISLNRTDYDEILNTFTSELAHIAYFSISRLNSGVYIDSILKHSDLIHQMCLLYEQENKNQSKTLNYTIPNRTSDESYKTAVNNSNSYYTSKLNTKISSSYGSSFNENVSVIGNQIQINHTNDKVIDSNKNFIVKFSEQELKENKSKIDQSRHLSDNWLAYWENEIRSNDKTNQFDFKHINLLTLSGHTSGVRCLLALENETSLISGSRDKTVKLWNIKNQTGITSGSIKKSNQTCQWTYNQHKKAVFSLAFIESQRLCASCDGAVHVWDPFSGRRLLQLDSLFTATCMTSLETPASCFIAATTDNLAKFIDLRLNGIAQEFRTCQATAGAIKSITANDYHLLVSFSTGLTCLIDMRTGWIIEMFKSHDNEIIQTRFLASNQFVSSYNDGTIVFCSIRDKIYLKQMLKSYSEPVLCMSVTENQLITATSSNKIGVHSNVDSAQIVFSMNKLQPDFFKGFITSQIYLKLNRLLLIGSDYGDIRVVC